MDDAYAHAMQVQSASLTPRVLQRDVVAGKQPYLGQNSLCHFPLVVHSLNTCIYNS
jgi:hypothetical protein